MMSFSVLIGMVDVIFADVAQPDQARIVAINAHNFLKNGGHVVISIKVGYLGSETWLLLLCLSSVNLLTLSQTSSCFYVSAVRI